MTPERLQKKDILKRLHQGLIVSVQASGEEPLNQPEILCALAGSVLQGGACAVRMAQADNIQCFKKHYSQIPVIGITKPHHIPANAESLVYITPTFQDLASIASCSDIVALDATMRPRPGGDSLAQLVQMARAQFPDLLLMADVATLEDGLNAESLGFDCIGTTLSGYTQETRFKALDGPDFELLAQLVAQTKVPIILEGRIWQPNEVEKAFKLGAFAVVVGSAITRPHEITKRFVAGLPK